ncbi:MAG: DNA-binding protein WhiA [Ruminococcaceae bacterium]|nr:DNA-binding protein WhiA [Oscillospiraceae bacterium]
MSYCSRVKDEVCGYRMERACCKKALLNAAFAFFNTVSDSKIKMNIENEGVAGYINSLISELCPGLNDVGFRENKGKKGYVMNITSPVIIRTLAEKIGLINRKTGQILADIDDNLSVDSCCQRASVIGAFLISGSVTDPDRQYHFEISNHRKSVLHKINEILVGMDFVPKIIKRGSDYVLYLKEKEGIADMLNYLGARETFFEYHDAMIIKDAKNRANRKANCENANVTRVVNAAVAQSNAIRKLIEEKRFDTLPEGLKEIAMLRLKHTDASLSDLAEMCSEPISRSGINHRMKKIMEIASEGK